MAAETKYLDSLGNFEQDHPAIVKHSEFEAADFKLREVVVVAAID